MVVPFDFEFQVLREFVLVACRIDREFREVRRVDRAVRKAVVEIDSRKGRAEAQFLGRVDLPEIFRAEAVEVIREGLVAAERENVVAVSGSIKQFVCVRLVGAPIDHDAVLAGFIEREGHVAVEFAGLERAAIETELALGRAVRFLELDVDNAEAAVRSEIQ